jgi:DNA topoisomerase-1
MDGLTLAEALELFKLPRTLGAWDDGYPIKVAVGRFGPYVQFGAKKYVSLKKEDDPYTITEERARQLIREKLEVEAARVIKEFPEAGIQVLNGRYGPYITDGKKNGKIPKDRDPNSLTLEECQAILAVAPERGTNRWGRKTAAKTTGKTAAKATDAEVAAEPKKKTAAKKKAAAKNKAVAKKKAPAKKSA